MTFAGHQHIVVAVGAQFNGALQVRGGDRGGGRPQAGLRFLAAEAAAHAAAFHHHAVRMHAQRVGNDMLHFRGMLGRTQYQHALVFFGNCIGYLAFEVELFLPADVEFTLDAICGAALECLLEIAARQAHRRQYERLRLLGRLGRHDCRQLRIVDCRQARGAACIVVRIRHHHKQRLPDILHQIIGKNRVVVDDRPTIVGAGDIRCGVNTASTPGDRLTASRLMALTLGVRFYRRQAQRRVCTVPPQFRQVVGIRRFAQRIAARRIRGSNT